MKRLRYCVILALVTAAAANSYSGTCNNAYLAEGQLPPAFDGIQTTATGFVARFWVWGSSPSLFGSDPVGLTDDGTGVAVNPGVLWANSSNCTGSVGGTGLLLEAKSTSSGGLFALVAVAEAESDLDALQGGSLQSVAQSLPTLTVTSAGTGTDEYGPYSDYLVEWTAPTTALALSDVTAPLAGYSLWMITLAGGGPVNTGDKTGFLRLGADVSASSPYVTDDPDSQDGLLPASQSSCHVRIRPNGTYYLALSVFLDGSAATGDPEADPSAVETTYIGACSAAITPVDPLIFSDGFEDSTTNAWSATVG